MTYYLKKHWKINVLIFLIQIVWAATMVIPNVLLMRLGQEIVNRNIKMFIFWLVVDLGIQIFIFVSEFSSLHILSMNTEISKKGLTKSPF